MQNEAITLKNTTHKKKSYLHISIFLYWAILVVWQNIGEYTARTTIDTMLLNHRIKLIVSCTLFMYAQP